ncbi:TIGR04283 family arsenosugar biosynthesis glycosyltransferase [Marinobacterium sp. D7]|uniref:TIGR04283 family arsenosugar biosynthesis glycosyltransferase n=1 Tax=Marinobacterium ramblicola TaxID=2849041 RepID=UPI001C2DE16C|nr:TIGR04283 family arsenosugar biosynthesis glycosyltransferase [Marinobacterium ramblicola]MBV1790667.1 TIGR04283 family arsenosugar biosynthesis glycosyltransferase [Marinobacterium ramblicola]
MKISIIVPLLNEADALPDLLTHLTYWREHDCEVLLVDGGSSDGSPERILAQGFTLLSAPRGRARQMNAGAARASGDLLLFLHADSRLPDDGLEQLRRLDDLSADIWGRFDVRIQGRPWMLRVIARAMNLRSRLTGIATGDQAIFVGRALFERVGGYPDQPLMEDIELTDRLRKVQRPLCLDGPVLTSGRRWEQCGVWRTIGLMWQLRWAYWRGAAAEQLAGRYR